MLNLDDFTSLSKVLCPEESCSINQAALRSISYFQSRCEKKRWPYSASNWPSIHRPGLCEFGTKATAVGVETEGHPMGQILARERHTSGNL